MPESTTKKTITPALKKEIIRIIDQRIAEVHVTREDFSELKSIVKELAEAQKRTETKVEELAEAQKRTEIKVEELVTIQKSMELRMDRGFKEMRDSISALGGRWGIMAEDTFRNAIKGLLEDKGYSIDKGYYGNREVDIIIRNGEHIMFEITWSMKKTDIARYIESARDYEAKTGISKSAYNGCRHLHIGNRHA